MKLLNKTARVIVVGEHTLIPLRPCEVGGIDGLSKKYPRVSELIEAGELVKVSAKEATKAEQAFEEENLASLKKAAEDKGLDVSGAKTKQDYIDLLKG